MSLEESFNKVLARFGELAETMGQGTLSPDEFTVYSKEYAELEPIAQRIQELQERRSEMGDLAGLMTDPDADAEMKAMAEEEFRALKERIPELERDLQRMLLPKDEADQRNAILEVRSGTGGD